MVQAMASICNDERETYGVMSGHVRKTLSLLAHFSLPNRPAGRIISMMAMITNTTMFEASG